MLRIEPSARALTPTGGGAQRKRLLVVCSHLRWKFVFQRPQHLLTRAARDFRVIFFEEPEFGGTDKPIVEVAFLDGVMVATPRLPHGHPDVAAAERQLLDGLLRGDQPDILWFYTPAALRYASHLQPGITVYDNMDELAAFKHADPKLLEQEAELLRRADLVFTGGVSLYEAKKHRHSDIHAMPSSVDVAHFGKARLPGLPEPERLRGIARPRVGFFGVIDERLDTMLLDECARLRPDWQFVMVGPVVKIDEADLPRRPNIHWLGGADYQELPNFLAHWDAAFMPFALNESTRFISPTKTPEFLAAGLVVASTAIRDVERPYGERGIVAIAEDACSMVEALEQLMAQPREPWLAKTDALLATMSWDKTWDAMKRRMLAKLGDGATISPITAGRPSVNGKAAGSAKDYAHA